MQSRDERRANCTHLLRNLSELGLRLEKIKQNLEELSALEARKPRELIVEALDRVIEAQKLRDEVTFRVSNIFRDVIQEVEEKTFKRKRPEYRV